MRWVIFHTALTIRGWDARGLLRTVAYSVTRLIEKLHYALQSDFLRCNEPYIAERPFAFPWVSSVVDELQMRRRLKCCAATIQYPSCLSLEKPVRNVETRHVLIARFMRDDLIRRLLNASRTSHFPSRESLWRALAHNLSDISGDRANLALRPTLTRITDDDKHAYN